MPIVAALISDSRPLVRHQLQLQDHRPRAGVWQCDIVACLLPSFHWYQFILLGNRHMGVNNLPRVVT